MASWLGNPNVDVYKDIHLDWLPLNHAYVIVNTTLKNLGVYSVSEECYKCPYKRLQKYIAFSRSPPAVYQVSAGEWTKWRILNDGNDEYIHNDYKRGLLCEMKTTLGEFGVYKLDVGRCTMETEVPPVNIYIPLLLFCLIISTAGAAIGLVKLFQRRHNEARYNDRLNLTAKRDNSDIMPSLHFLRGILLLLLIFSMAGGGGYPVFSKSYGGLTVANCLLFAYMFTVGLKTPVMYIKDYGKEVSTLTSVVLIHLRALVLLIVGITISGMSIRSYYLAASLWEPLSCIALSYFVVVLTYTVRRENQPMNAAAGLLRCWLVGGLFVVTMIACTYVLYFTQCRPYADFDPRRYSWVSKGNNCEEDDLFQSLMNKNLLRINSDEPFYVDYYYTYTEGVLGIISMILTALIGLKAGVIYVQHEEHTMRTKWWCIWAVMFGVAGVGFAAVSRPLNFNLWPISTIFLISSLTLFVFVIIYRLTEVHKISCSIIRTCGVGSVAIFAGHLLFSYNFPFYWGMDFHNHFIYLWQSTWVVALWVFITVCWVKWSTHLMMR